MEASRVLDRLKCLDEQICFAPNPFERSWFGTNSSSKHGTSHRLNKVYIRLAS